MDASYSNQLIFWLNGIKVEISNPDPTIKLTDYLRDVGLTGTKVSCGQGDAELVRSCSHTKSPMAQPFIGQ